jgi:hypothetical protein
MIRLKKFRRSTGLGRINARLSTFPDGSAIYLKDESKCMKGLGVSLGLEPETVKFILEHKRKEKMDDTIRSEQREPSDSEMSALHPGDTD